MHNPRGLTYPRASVLCSPSRALPGSTFMDKVVTSPAEAVTGIVNGSSLAVGGFGLCGVPSVLIAELHRNGVTDLEAFSNNCGVDDWGLGIVLKSRQLRRVAASYLGGNKEFERQF